MEPQQLIHDLNIPFMHYVMHLKTKSVLMYVRHLLMREKKESVFFFFFFPSLVDNYCDMGEFYALRIGFVVWSLGIPGYILAVELCYLIV